MRKPSNNTLRMGLLQEATPWTVQTVCNGAPLIGDRHIASIVLQQISSVALYPTHILRRRHTARLPCTRSKQQRLQDRLQSTTPRPAAAQPIPRKASIDMLARLRRNALYLPSPLAPKILSSRALRPARPSSTPTLASPTAPTPGPATTPLPTLILRLPTPSPLSRTSSRPSPVPCPGVTGAPPAPAASWSTKPASPCMAAGMPTTPARRLAPRRSAAALAAARRARMVGISSGVGAFGSVGGGKRRRRAGEGKGTWARAFVVDCGGGMVEFWMWVCEAKVSSRS